MAQFVLVHGSYHGAWCWERLVPLLHERGHTVVAPNLPGSGDDPAPPENASLETYVTRIAGAIDNLAGPIVLVGHSMGGLVASQVAERRASRLAGIVYVNGLLLTAGESLVSFLNAHPDLTAEDRVLQHMRVSEDGETATFPPEAALSVFYNACAPADAAWAAGRLRPQRTRVYRDALALTDEGFGSVRRFYVEGLRDEAVSIALQRAMAARLPCEQVFTLDGDHSPFLSLPEAVAGLLDDVARRTG